MHAVQILNVHSHFGGWLSYGVRKHSLKFKDETNEEVGINNKRVSIYLNFPTLLLDYKSIGWFLTTVLLYLHCSVYPL